jgi:tetratricopeptide (TPR) repeat protein
MGYDVFISYSNRDRAVAESICAAMKTRGMSCWVAPESVQPGSFWASQIVQAIEQSKAVVMVFSSAANSSPQLPREAELAVSYRRALIPYRIENVDPEGALRYFLGITHRLDAIYPASTDPENLSRLCEAVERTIQSHPPLQKVIQAEGLLKDKTSKDLRLRLAGEMIRRKQAIICADALSLEDRKSLESLEKSGHFTQQPSLISPAGNRFSALAKPEDCLDLLAEWIQEQAAAPEQLLDLAAGFPLLFDAIAKALLERPEHEISTAAASFASIDKPASEKIIQALVDRIDLPGSPIQEAQEKAQKLAKFTLHRPAIPAIRGLLLGAQRMIGRSRINPAIAIYEQVELWGENHEAIPGVKRLMVESANERARADIRKGLIDPAERRLREALEISGDLKDPILTGILTNNLARALLERFSPARRDEAIRILEGNLTRLAGAEGFAHLAAAYNNLGDALTTVDSKRAEECFRKDVEICRDTKDEAAVSDALHGLANFLMNQGSYEQAIPLQEQELSLYEHFFDPRRHARALANLGRAHLGRWKKSRDRRDLELALTPMEASREWFLTCPDEPRLFAPALENLGRVLFLLGRREEGMATLKDCILQYRRLPEGGQIAEEIEAELSQLDP